MLKVFRGWLDRYLSDEESVLLASLLIVGLLIILTMGSIIAPIITGVILAFVMQGVIKLLSRYRVPNGIAVTLTFVVFLGISFSFLVFVIPRVWNQMVSLFDELPDMIERTQAVLRDLPANYPSLISEQQLNRIIEQVGAGAGDMGQWLFSYSLAQLSLLVSMVLYVLVVPLLVFFFLKDKDQILAWFLGFLPDRRPLIDRIGREMNQQMANYVRGKVIEIIITGGATFVLFKLFGLDYAALLAFLVGLSVIIPYIGIAVVSVPVVLIAYLQFGLLSPFLYLMLGYTVVQLLDGFVLVPLLFSEVVNLHPVAIIAAVIVFGSLWGLWGVFFAIPLATLIKSIVDAWPDSAGDPRADS